MTVSPIQVGLGDPVEVLAAGFTPNHAVISHLRRPDQTEYDVKRFLTDARGEYSHTIETLLLDSGTYELWAVDETSKAVSNIARFTVGFEASSPASPEVQQALRRYVGVWRGSGARNTPPVPSTILIAITGANTGSVAGTIAYPTLSCGGELTFHAVRVDSIELSEKLTYGTDRCKGNGLATIKPSQDGSLVFEWRDPILRGTATGKLESLK